MKVQNKVADTLTQVASSAKYSHTSKGWGTTRHYFEVSLYYIIVVVESGYNIVQFKSMLNNEDKPKHASTKQQQIILKSLGKEIELKSLSIDLQ
jgi:hypothetical protein